MKKKKSLPVTGDAVQKSAGGADGGLAQMLLAFGDLPVRQYVVTIPKMLRLSFKYDRKLLGLLSQCFCASVKELFQ